jgi:hypothetical protein
VRKALSDRLGRWDRFNEFRCALALHVGSPNAETQIKNESQEDNSKSKKTYF